MKSKINNIHYSWLVCACCFLVIMCSVGFATSGFSVLIPYIKASTGLSNVATNSIVTTRQIASAVFLCIFNPIHKKLGSKKCIVFAMFAEMLCFALFANAKNLATYIEGALFAGFSYSFGGIVVVSFLITEWFSQKKATALGICLAGSGFSSVVFAPILTDIVEKYSLSAAFYCLAGLFLLVAVLSFFILANSPKDKGLSAYGEDAGVVSVRKFGNGISQKDFVWVLVGMFFMGIAANITSLFSASLYRSCGYDSYIVALISSIFGLTVIIGKIIYGRMADTKGSFLTFGVFHIIYLIGTLLCGLANNHSNINAFIAMALVGVGVCTTTVGVSIGAADFSNSENYSKRLSRMQTVFAIGSIISGLESGFISDCFGNYVMVIFVNAINIVICGVVFVIGYKNRSAH